MAPKNICTQAVLRIAEVEQRLSAMPNPILAPADLSQLEIHRGTQLDIDKVGAPHSGPIFFKPLSDSAELRGAVSENEKDRSSWNPCTQNHHATHCADHLGSWFAYLSFNVVRRLIPSGDSRWQGRR